MLPEAKAKELYNKFYWSITEAPPKENKANAIRCSIICVDEILSNNDNLWLSDGELDYWQQVKTFIQSK